MAQRHDEITEQGGMTVPSTGRTCILTTYSRQDGRPQDTEMRYAIHDGNIYLLATEGGDAQWVQNLLANPEVSARVGTQTVGGMARVLVNDSSQDQLARELLAEKYDSWHAGQPLSEWVSQALPVVIEVRG